MRRLLVFALSLALASPSGAQARAASAGIVGRVVDLQSRTPISGARIALLGTPRRGASDTSGRFREVDLAPGIYLLEVRAIGYAMASWVLRLAAGEVLDQDFELEAAPYALDPVVVETRPTFSQQRMQEFERRQRLGRGTFITADEIESSNAASLVDILRGVAGVRVICRSGGCQVRMTRTRGEGCQPDWVVDGFPATQSATPHLPTVGIVGIEIYRSATETPTEFLKSDSQCGVIVIWTKSGP